MAIPNPYTFWSGFALNSLSSIFGGASSSAIQQQIERSNVEINYNLGFTFMIPADLTIGSIQNVQVREGNREEGERL